MDTDEMKAAAPPLGGHDEVDFTSGYETQYKQEYRPLKAQFVPPPDRKLAWYRSWGNILMILFLAGVFLLGTILLVVKVSSAGPLQVLLIVAVYVIFAALMIWLDVKSGMVR